MRAVQWNAIVLVLASVLAGCASAPPPNQAKLTYETVPEGAVIFEAGQSLGPAPVTRTYTGDGKSDSIKTPDVTAVWPSGAKATFWTNLKVGSDRVATIDRPSNAPGLQADLDNAKQFAASSANAEKRAKEAIARDIARNSARCKDQMQKGNLATNDC